MVFTGLTSLVTGAIGIPLFLTLLRFISWGFVILLFYYCYRLFSIMLPVGDSNPKFWLYPMPFVALIALIYLGSVEGNFWADLSIFLSGCLALLAAMHVYPIAVGDSR